MKYTSSITSIYSNTKMRILHIDEEVPFRP